MKKDIFLEEIRQHIDNIPIQSKKEKKRIRTKKILVIPVSWLVIIVSVLISTGSLVGFLWQSNNIQMTGEIDVNGQTEATVTLYYDDQQLNGDSLVITTMDCSVLNPGDAFTATHHFDNIGEYTFDVTINMSGMPLNYIDPANLWYGLTIKAYEHGTTNELTTFIINPNSIYEFDLYYAVDPLFADPVVNFPFNLRIDIELYETPPQNSPPTAYASADTYSGVTPLIVQFTGSGLDTDGSIVSYQWEFGDGNTSNIQNPSHTYSLQGIYIVTLTVTDNQGGVGIDSLTISVTTLIVPILSYSSSSYNFGSITAGTAGSTTFEIRNGAPGTLTYSLSEASSWVTVTPTSGDIAAWIIDQEVTISSEYDIITVNIDTTELNPGLYTCNISISSNGGSGTFTVVVTIINQLYDPPFAMDDFYQLGPGDEEIQFLVLPNDYPGNSGNEFGITNFSQTAFAFQTVTLNADWYYFYSPLINASEWESATFTYNATDGISITSAMVTVYNNQAPSVPILSYNPSSYSFGYMDEGQIVSTSFQIWNSGTGTLTYVFDESSSWVTVTPTSGDSIGEYDTITVNVDTTGLSPDEYTCLVNINSNVGSGTFTVALNVFVPTEVLDQLQPDYGSYFSLYGTTWSGQSFVPTISTLTRVELYIRKIGNPSNLVLSVRNDLFGADLVSISKPSSEILTSSSWIEFNFDDLIVTPDSMYYLILKTNNGNPGNCYTWGYDGGYSIGDMWYTTDGGSHWIFYHDYDFSFKIYGILPPVLSYSPSICTISLSQDQTDSTFFSIWNSGGGTLIYTIGAGCSWLTVTPTIGYHSETDGGPYNPDLIRVSINKDGLLSPGFYTYPIYINSNGGFGTFTVYLTVVSP